MRWTVILIAVVACTARNPEVCCETMDECASLGWDSTQPCVVGACVGRICVERGACDGPEDCLDGSTCVESVCELPQDMVDASIDAPPDSPEIPPELMVVIAAGDFIRGCNVQVDDCSSRSDELPAVSITMFKFSIDVTEVTQGAYKRCMDVASCSAPTSGFDPIGKPAAPVTGVNWAQANDYCFWAKKRLPSEAEWEEAARGTSGLKYPWGNALPNCTLAHYLDCPLGTTQAMVVGSKSGNSPYGLKDMGGNVSEWVNDWYDANYYGGSSPVVNPQGPNSGQYKVIRGGGWGFGIDWLRSSKRYYMLPTSSSMYTGFRCASN